MATKQVQRQQQQQRVDPIDERLQAIVEERETAPDELCAYLAQSIREASTEREGLVKRITEAEQFLAQFRTRLAAVTGVLQKAHGDLRKKLSAGKPDLRPVEDEEKVEGPPSPPEKEMP